MCPPISDTNTTRFLGLQASSFPGERWRDLDRSYLRLKCRFYRKEIARAQTLRGTRPERYEPKALKSRRDIRFVSSVLELVGSCGGSVFAHGVKKKSTRANHSYEGLYNSLMQGTLRAFEKYCRLP